MKDEDLIYGLKIRDPGISEIFYSAYAPLIYRVSLAILGQAVPAQDCTQDVLLKILKGIHTFKGRSSLKTWIVSITVNSARTHLKRFIKKEKRSVSIEDLIFPAKGENPEQKFLRGERQEVILKALEQIPSDYREILILRETEGLSYEEIAEILTIPIGTVRSRLARARLALAALYSEEIDHEAM